MAKQKNLTVINKITLTLIVTTALFLIYFLLNSQKETQEKIILKVNNIEINAEIADSKIEITKGLSDRDFLDESSGMYFVLGEREVVNFWMKGMRFPIDIIWIDSGKITGLTKNASVPQNGKIPTYTSPTAITNVLEVNAGFADKYNIKIDDKVETID